MALSKVLHDIQHGPFEKRIMVLALGDVERMGRSWLQRESEHSHVIFH